MIQAHQIAGVVAVVEEAAAVVVVDAAVNCYFNLPAINKRSMFMAALLNTRMFSIRDGKN